MPSISRRKLLAAVAGMLPASSRLGSAFAFLDANGEQAGAQKYWFTDVSRKSSFSYRSNNNFTGRKYFPQPMCGGVAAIDYNNDGLYRRSRSLRRIRF